MGNSLRCDKLRLKCYKLLELGISCFKQCIVFLASADANFVQTVIFINNIFIVFIHIHIKITNNMFFSASVSIEGKFLFKISSKLFWEGNW